MQLYKCRIRRRFVAVKKYPHINAATDFSSVSVLIKKKMETLVKPKLKVILINLILL